MLVYFVCDDVVDGIFVGFGWVVDGQDGSEWIYGGFRVCEEVILVFVRCFQWDFLCNYLKL